MEQLNACDYFVDRHVREGCGERVALRCRGRSLTYSALLDAVTGAAAGLRELGLRPEERVLLVLLDGVELAATFLAALRIGAIPVPVNPLLPAGDLASIAADARARVALVAAEKEAVARELGADAPELRAVLVGAEVEALLAATGDGAPHATWPDSPGFWLCTSGTTGRPKLAMHRHADLQAIVEGYGTSVLGLRPGDRCYSVAPMFHAYGLGNSLAFPLGAGATAILEPARPPAPKLVAELVASERPTLFFAVPTFYAHLLAAELEPATFASVRQAVSAGEALPAELFERFRERFGVEILDGIGSTELAHVFISNRPGQVRAGTSGLPVDGYLIRLVDDEGKEVAPGAPGHLLVSGDTAATGYWCRTAESRRTFQGEWVRTGDVYARSEDGYYTYLGRSDDLLKVGGEWVSPVEVESVLVEHPAVLEAAVVGERTRAGLVQPVAYVVPAAGRELDPGALIELCRARLAGYKRPRRIEVLDALPRTATGKVRRTELAAPRERQAAPGPD